MTNFVSAALCEEKSEKINSLTVDTFIGMYNKFLKKGSFIVNDRVDGLPVLNDAEFKIVKERAERNGWILERGDDNYQSTMYTMSKKSHERN